MARQNPCQRIWSSPPSKPTADEAPSEPLGIVWEGEQLTTYSFAIVNREFCLRLIQRGHDVSLLSKELEKDTEAASSYSEIVAHLNRDLSRPIDVHVRHVFPPTFRPPPAGRWVLMQPFEFGSLPRWWIEPMREQVDEVWVYTNWLRECYLGSGLPADRVQVVPLGVDGGCFNPQARPLPLKTSKHFKFLFVGGTVHRKGIDLLLDAYARTFTADDDVCLVIKEMGNGTIYRDTAEKQIAQHQASARAPEIEYLDRELTKKEMAKLYAACDCLVHPYRGEGFALPIAEAMACGLPVIVTGYGAALDYCNESNAYLLPAQIVHFHNKRIFNQETVDYPWLAEPNWNELKYSLRHVVDHPAEAKAKGAAASAHILGHFTWERALEVMEDRLDYLRRQPIRRNSTRARRTVVAARPAGANGKPRCSLCVIVKNEEANLSECLQSAAGLFDEIIVVDTGSSDGTKTLAERLGAKVFDFPWVDSFAAARNECLRHATGEWIFWLDADDRLDEENRKKLEVLIGSLKGGQNAAYVMKCLSQHDEKSDSATLVAHVRLFPNRPDVRWKYRVHEQVSGALRQAGVEVLSSDVLIHHVGYQVLALRQRKLERNMRLLKLEDTDNPNDPFVLFYLGASYSWGERAEAVPLLQRGLKLSQPRDPIVRMLYALLAQCQRQLDRKEEALRVCQAGLELFPNDAELLFQEGLTRHVLKDYEGAVAALQRLLTAENDPHLIRETVGLRGPWSATTWPLFTRRWAARPRLRPSGKPPSRETRDSRPPSWLWENTT